MKKFTALFILAIFVFSGLTYWTWSQLLISPVTTTTIKLSVENILDNLDPAKAYSDDSLVVSAQVIEPLYQYHYLKRPYEIQPLSAEALPQITENGTLLQIKIKKGILYHDHPSFGGRPRELNALDFVIEFKRLAMHTLNSPGRSLFSGLIVGFDEYSNLIGGDWKRLPSSELIGVSAPDPFTLNIRLTRPEPNIIYYLALNFVAPVPWEVVQYEKNVLDKVLIGTGPYVYRGFNGEHYRMEKFKKYREDYYPTSGDRYANVQRLLDSSQEKIPFIDEIIFSVITQENERWGKFLAKELDLLNVPKTFITNLYGKNGELNPELKVNNVELKHFPILANRWLGFNMKDPILGKNEFLRRAIAYGIDYDKYIQVISQNTNLRANSILVPGISGYLPAKDFRFRYDLALAKEYLKMSGLTKSGQTPTITYSTRGNQGINIVEAELIKEMLSKIGLKIEIQVLTFSEFLKKGRAGELMFFTDNWLFDYPDGENILQLLVSTNSPGINKSGYSNPKIDLLYQKLKQTTNIDQRDKIIHEMEDVAFSDLPWIPLMYESSFVLQYPEIKNFRKSSIIRNFVKYLKIVR